LHHPGRIISDNLVSDAYFSLDVLDRGLSSQSHSRTVYANDIICWSKKCQFIPTFRLIEEGVDRNSGLGWAVAAMLLLSATAAFANPITTFNLTSTFSSAIGAAYGTITIDTATGTVESINLSFAGEPASATELGSTFDLVGSGPNALVEFGETWGTLGFYSVDILLPVNTLVGYAGGPICSTANPCYGGALSGFAFGISGNKPYTGGTLSATPEAASWMFVATGAVGLLTILQRRRHRPGVASLVGPGVV
jgi:hypothetical protein